MSALGLEGLGAADAIWGIKEVPIYGVKKAHAHQAWHEKKLARGLDSVHDCWSG